MPRPVFDNVGSVMPGRSVFDLSYEKKLTCDMGQLIPIMCDEVVPGDSLDIGNQIVVRFQPLVAPIMHEVNVFTHYFFVPYRLLWADWEDFITGGKDGQNASVLPRWSPTNNAIGSLWTISDSQRALYRWVLCRLICPVGHTILYIMSITATRR